MIPTRKVALSFGDQLKKIAQKLLSDSERLVESMRSLCSLLEPEVSSTRTAH